MSDKDENGVDHDVNDIVNATITAFDKNLADGNFCRQCGMSSLAGIALINGVVDYAATRGLGEVNQQLIIDYSMRVAAEVAVALLNDGGVELAPDKRKMI